MQHLHPLPDRTLIHLSGADPVIYLQGLLTQDVSLLTQQPLLYSHILTAQGRYEGECFLTRWQDGILLDFPTPVWNRLGPKLKLLKLRRDVVFTHLNTLNVLVAFTATGKTPGAAPDTIPAKLSNMPAHHAYMDPRLPVLGMRYYCETAALPKGLITEIETYQTHCLMQGVPSDERGLVPGKTISLEAGLEKLSGISFSKGCYLGQELMSRTHHQGQIRKRLFPFTILGESRADLSLVAGMKVYNNEQIAVGDVVFFDPAQKHGFVRLKLSETAAYFQGQSDLLVDHVHAIHVHQLSWM